MTEYKETIIILLILIMSRDTKILRFLSKKRSPKTFGVKTERPLKFSNESKATSCPRTFDRTNKDS